MHDDAEPGQVQVVVLAHGDGAAADDRAVDGREVRRRRLAVPADAEPRLDPEQGGVRLPRRVRPLYGVGELDPLLECGHVVGAEPCDVHNAQAFIAIADCATG